MKKKRSELPKKHISTYLTQDENKSFHIRMIEEGFTAESAYLRRLVILDSQLLKDS